MAIAVVYYSKSGHTEFIAKRMCERLGAVPFCIRPKHPIPDSGFRMYFLGGMQAVFHLKPALVGPDTDLSAYDTVIVGSPVWAGLPASPLRSFLSSAAITEKHIRLFASNASGETGKYFSALARMLPHNIIEGTVAFLESPEKDEATVIGEVDQFCDSLSTGK